MTRSSQPAAALPVRSRLGEFGVDTVEFRAYLRVDRLGQVEGCHLVADLVEPDPGLDASGLTSVDRLVPSTLLMTPPCWLPMLKGMGFHAQGGGKFA